MGFQFSIYALVDLVAIGIMVAVAFAIWRKRHQPPASIFVALMICSAGWTASAMLSLVSTTLTGKIIFSNSIFVFVAIIPNLWLVFVLVYTGHDRWLQRQRWRWLLWHPIITVTIVLTNPLHHAFWLKRAIKMQDGLVLTDFIVNWFFWLHTTYSYIVLMVSLWILIQAVWTSPRIFRIQIYFLLFGITLPIIANIVFLFGFKPFPHYIDATPLALGLGFIGIAYALYRYRLMDIVPIARARVIDSMVEAMFIIDPSNRLVDVNAAALAMVNYRRDELIGHPIKNFVRNVDFVERYHDVRQALTEVALTINDETRYYEFSLNPLYTRNGDFTGRVATFHDITRLKQANIELEAARQRADEATRLKTDFLATVSHELRTPLNAVIGYSELMLTGMVGDLPAKHQTYQRRILSSANHLLLLINNILDISQIEAGKMQLSLETFALRPWLQQLTAQSALTAQAKGLVFTLEIDDDMPEILFSDPNHLERIIHQLLDNALKFTERGSIDMHIRLGTTNTWQIIIQDTGIGVPVAMQQVIFQQFRQVDHTLSYTKDGLGVGLSIVSKLVNLMSGFIRLESQAGAGSTFTVTLPFMQIRDDT